MIKNLTWKDFNKKENEKLLDVEGISEIVDSNREKAREIEMLNNINKYIIENGTVLIITGTAHLNFFEKNIKTAIFPFRNS